MQIFKDADGRSWEISATEDKLRRIRKEMRLDFIKNPGKAFKKLSNCAADFGDLLWILCHEQAEKRRISDHEFGRLLCAEMGDELVLNVAAEAFISELFTRKRKRGN